MFGKTAFTAYPRNDGSEVSFVQVQAFFNGLKSAKVRPPRQRGREPWPWLTGFSVG